jgi:hypothetical protein
MRSPRIVLAALIGLAGCTFDAEKSDMNFEVTNIDSSTSDSVNHLIVTLTLPDASTHTYQPTFGAVSNPALALALPSGGQTGAYTLKVEQFDRNATSFGSTTTTGVLTGTGVGTPDSPVVVALPAAP